MESEKILWFVFVALFFILFIVSVVRYHTNPKVLSQLAIFSLLCAIVTIVLAARHYMHKPEGTTDDDLLSRQQAWLNDTPLPLVLPPISIILFNALFDAQFQFFQFYAVVLTNYDRWAALHINGTNTTTIGSNPNLFSSAWRWTNRVLVILYGLSVVGLVACQAIFHGRQFWLARAIGTSVLAGCVLLNLLSNVFTRYKMKYRYRRHLKMKKEMSGLKSALTTPEDRSKRSLLILILSPALCLVSLLALATEMWIIHWALTRTTDLIPSALFGTITTASMVIDSVLVCIPMTLVFIIHVVYVKPYPLIVSSHDLNSLP